MLPGWFTRRNCPRLIKNMILNKSCTYKIFKLCFLVPASSSWPYFLAGGRNGFEIGDSGSHVIREAGRGYLDAGRGYTDRRGAPRNHYGNGSRERGKLGPCKKLFLVKRGCGKFYFLFLIGLFVTISLLQRCGTGTGTVGTVTFWLVEPEPYR